MNEHRVQVEDLGAVRMLTLSRPEKKNAFDIAMATQLWEALESAEANSEVRAIVVTGQGDYFTGGADVGIFLSFGNADPSQLLKVARMHEPLRACTKPVIAMVQGHAVGMGVTLLPHFDLVYAADHATFMTPFVKLGLVLEFGSSYALPRLIGAQRTRELILRAAPIDAQTAAQWGLVTRTFVAEELRDQVLAIAADIANNPPGAVAESKRLIELGLDATMAEAIASEDASLSTRYGSEENVRAVTAFLDRRKR